MLSLCRLEASFCSIRFRIQSGGMGMMTEKTETKSTGEEAMAIPAQLTGAEL